MFQLIHVLEALNTASNEVILFAGTDAGLFTSQDGGKTWEDALEKSGLRNIAAVTALKALPSAGNGVTLLAGTVGGAYRSTDRGMTWEAVIFGRPVPTVTAFCAAQGKSFHAATLADGVYSSSNDGQSWARWNFGLLDWRVYALAAVPAAFTGAGLLFAGAESGLYCSKNNGRTWNETTFPDGIGAVLSLAALPDGSRLFAGTENGAIYSSVDRGESWSVVFEDADAAEVLSIAAVAPGEGAWLAVAACGDRVYGTRDGSVWQPLAVPAAFTGSSITTLSAPGGLCQGALLWGGGDDGSVFSMTL